MPKWRPAETRIQSPADPGAWGVPPQYAGAFANAFLRKRARAAAKLKKPYIVHGVGMVRAHQQPHCQMLLGLADVNSVH